MRQLFWMVVTLLVSSATFTPAVAHATTSCSPTIRFLGYESPAIYYEVEGGGDCIPFKAMYHADLQRKQIYELIRVGGEVGDDWQQQYAQRKDHWMTVHRTQLATPVAQKLSKSCNLGTPLLESEVEPGMHSKVKKIRKAFYYNGEPAFWVVISAHCYEAAWSGYTDKTCPTIDHLSVYQTQACVK